MVKLDVMPKLWEDTSLFMAYLIEKGAQSGTIKLYVSAIKRTLLNDKYKWKDELILLSSLTRACKLVNDRVKTRLPIHCNLLEMILFEIGRIYGEQPYLKCMYKALFALGYYGLLRVGELKASPHTIKARDVHMGVNEDKILVILYSSKTHDEGDRPQQVKITTNDTEKSGHYVHRNFCPFKSMREYMHIRGAYDSYSESLFIYRDKLTVGEDPACRLLRKAIDAIGLDSSIYDMHSLRIGRASDLIKYNYSVEEVKRLGSWKSNVVYKYIRT